MIVDLAVAYSDSVVDDLRFATGARQVDVLGRLDVDGWQPGSTVSLRLLGASHQAVLTTPDGEYVETLACLDDDGGAPPPDEHIDRVGPMTVRFTYRIDHLDSGAFSHRVAEVVSEAAENPRMLLGRFPGEPNAVTVLSADHATPRWRTVHAYPQTGAWVVTSTSMIHPPARRPARKIR